MLNYQRVPQKSTSFVGKYSSTMDHGELICDEWKIVLDPLVNTHCSYEKFHEFPIDLPI